MHVNNLLKVITRQRSLVGPEPATSESPVMFILQPDMRESIALFMSHVHNSVNEMSQVYLTNERRYNYTTPKSFLEQIKLYQNLLQAKFDELHGKTIRLENGLEKLKTTSAQVSSQGSVATRLRCGGIFIDLFIANFLLESVSLRELSLDFR